MATAIQPISMYTLKNDVLVLQNNIKRIFLKTSYKKNSSQRFRKLIQL